jgi:hypothetical protein
MLSSMASPTKARFVTPTFQKLMDIVFPKDKF